MWSLSRHFRKKPSAKYPDRFIQGIDYEETKSRWLPFLPQSYTMLRDRSTLTYIIDYTIEHEYFSLNKNGLLTVKKGYRSDGPSGWTMDTPSFMRGAIGVHDPLFQMLRDGLFGDITDDEFEDLFYLSNSELERICAIDGMMVGRKQLVQGAVQTFGRSSAGK